MSIRAKFTYNGYEASLYSRYPHRKPDGSPDYGRPEQAELRTLKFSPVYGNGDPEHENTKFWEASPTGQVVLGTINPEAWQHFEMGRQYYLDFTEAPDTEPTT